MHHLQEVTSGMVEQQVSSAVISRLPRYYRYLSLIMEEGIERISSKDLAARMRVTASQIRQDLNNFGGFGQQGYGYNVRHLYSEIEKILGIDNYQKVIMVGAGKLAQAIANYEQHQNQSFQIVALFDINPELIGTKVGDIPILSTDDMADYVRSNNVKIGALCVPKSQAVTVAKTMMDAGIKAIWNFATVDLDTPDDVVVENVHLSESLMRLSYRANSMVQEKSKNRSI